MPVSNKLPHIWHHLGWGLANQQRISLPSPFGEGLGVRPSPFGEGLGVSPCQPTTHITPLSPWRGVGGEAFTPWRGAGGEAFPFLRGVGGEASTFWREVGGEAFVNLSARLLTLWAPFSSPIANLAAKNRFSREFILGQKGVNPRMQQNEYLLQRTAVSTRLGDVFGKI